MAYIYNFNDTWNNAGTLFTGIGLNVTDTASSASSKLLDLQIGGSSKLNVAKDGSITMYRFGAPTVGTSYVQHQFLDVGDPQHRWLIDGSVSGAADVTGIIVGPNRWLSFPDIGALSPQSTSLRYGASGTIDQRAGGYGASGTTAQSYRLYNTYTDASNYERAKLSWGSNVLTIGTEAAGTGTKRNIVIDSANRSAYIASPTAEQIRDILISFGLMAPS